MNEISRPYHWHSGITRIYEVCPKILMILKPYSKKFIIYLIRFYPLLNISVCPFLPTSKGMVCPTGEVFISNPLLTLELENVLEKYFPVLVS